MGVFIHKQIHCRLDAEDRVEFKATDLARSSSTSLKQAALADLSTPRDGVNPSGNCDGWVSESELWRATGLGGSTPFDFQDLVHEAQQRGHKQVTLLALRRANRPLPPLPPPLARSATNLATRSRTDYVPLAEYLAHAFAKAESYASTIPDAAYRTYYFRADAVLRGRRIEEVAAACAILTAREGREVELCQNTKGQRFLVLGLPGEVETFSDLTGVDLIFHTHPLTGAQQAQPSGGDLDMAKHVDPNHRGAAVSEDGWWVGYVASQSGACDIEEPRRLWQLVM